MGHGGKTDVIRVIFVVLW